MKKNTEVHEEELEKEVVFPPVLSGDTTKPKGKSKAWLWILLLVLLAGESAASFGYMEQDGPVGGGLESALVEHAGEDEETRVCEAVIRDPYGIWETMVYVEGGSFQMGCTSEQSDGRSDEFLIHQVSVSSFQMSKYEITQKQWKAVMGTNPSHFKGDNLPVEQVSWDDIQTFIQALNAQTGKNYRLPTEAEWEYAARGGQKSKGFKYSGSSSLDNVGWYWKNSGDREFPGDQRGDVEKIKANNCKTHPVGQKRANELGLYDMSGNVSEWCSDWYDSDYYAKSPDRNPKASSPGSDRVCRGGDWLSTARRCRSSDRNYCSPGYRFSGLGFRLVSSTLEATVAAAERAKEAEAARQRKAAAARSPYGIWETMVYVEGGSFQMGCTSEQSDCGSNEGPVHEVSVSSFYISKYEITQKQWKAVMGTNPSHFKGDNLPVEQVSWEDVQAFIQALNVQTGKNYRLPTEAEWEYAARGGQKSKGFKYSGSSSVDNVGWYNVNSRWRTYPVGQKCANELGLYDMSGNVWEWCSDWYDSDYYAKNPGRNNPRGPNRGVSRVFRGGGWNGSGQDCRSAAREGRDPSYCYDSLGFRLVCP